MARRRAVGHVMMTVRVGGDSRVSGRLNVHSRAVEVGDVMKELVFDLVGDVVA